MEQIKNEHLTIGISAHGAELQSIKDSDGKEYLWQANPSIWGRHSPILFPIVCGLWNDTCRIDGKEFNMSRHGFARDTDFTLVAQGKEKVVYAMHENEATLKVYPYHFNLAVSYRLAKNKIKVVWHVENTGRKEMYFQIGGHPAFLIPGLLPSEPMHGRLRLDDTEPRRIFGNVKGCVTPEHSAVVTEEGILSFDEELFKDDALIFDHSQLHKVSLLNHENKAEVSVEFKAPAVGIWSPYGKNAPFVCIEPWYGIADWADYDGEFKDKYLMNKLLPGASFMSEYTITIGETDED